MRGITEIVLVYRNSVFNSPTESCYFVNDKLAEPSNKEGYCSVAFSGTSRLVSLGPFSFIDSKQSISRSKSQGRAF